MGIRIGAGVLAAVVVGSVLGAVARGLMALVALTAAGTSSFSWTGSTFILLIYALAMVPGGVVAGLTRRSLRWLLPVAGALFLCVPAIGVASDEIGSTVDFGALEWLGVGVFGAGIFVTIALAPLLTVRLTDRWLGRRDDAAAPSTACPRLPCADPLRADSRRRDAVRGAPVRRPRIRRPPRLAWAGQE